MIETSRLVIRPPMLSDAEDVHALSVDREVMRYTGDVIPPTLLETKKFLENIMIPQFEKFRMGRFLVFLKDGTFMGWSGLKYFPETEEVDLGYRLKKEYWGNGFATEAGEAMLHYGFHDLKLNRIIAKVMPQNLASIKVLQKLKMSFMGYHHDPTDPQPFLVYEKKRGTR